MDYPEGSDPDRPKGNKGKRAALPSSGRSQTSHSQGPSQTPHPLPARPRNRKEPRVTSTPTETLRQPSPHPPPGLPAPGLPAPRPDVNMPAKTYLDSCAVWISPVSENCELDVFTEYFTPSPQLEKVRVYVHPEVQIDDKRRRTRKIMLQFRGPSVSARAAALATIENFDCKPFMKRTLTVVEAHNTFHVSDFATDVPQHSLMQMISDCFYPRRRDGMYDHEKLGGVGEVRLLVDRSGKPVGEATVRFDRAEVAERQFEGPEVAAAIHALYLHPIGGNIKVEYASDQVIERILRSPNKVMEKPHRPVERLPKHSLLSLAINPNPASVRYDPGCGAQGAILISNISHSLAKDRESQIYMFSRLDGRKLAGLAYGKIAWTQVLETLSNPQMDSFKVLVQYDTAEAASQAVKAFSGKVVEGKTLAVKLALARLHVSGVDPAIVSRNMSYTNLKKALAKRFDSTNDASQGHNNYGKYLDVKLHEDNGRFDGTALINFKDPYVAEVELARHARFKQTPFMESLLDVRYATVAEVEERPSRESTPTPGQPTIVKSGPTRWV